MTITTMDAVLIPVNEMKPRPRKGRGLMVNKVRETFVKRGIRMGHEERSHRIQTEIELREQLKAAKDVRWRYAIAGAVIGGLLVALFGWLLLEIHFNQVAWHRSQAANIQGDTHE